ncbi:hypothetical protein ACI65C_007850 [Semiaphis heraclei]
MAGHDENDLSDVMVGTLSIDDQNRWEELGLDDNIRTQLIKIENDYESIFSWNIKQLTEPNQDPTSDLLDNVRGQQQIITVMFDKDDKFHLNRFYLQLVASYELYNRKHYEESYSEMKSSVKYLETCKFDESNEQYSDVYFHIARATTAYIALTLKIDPEKLLKDVKHVNIFNKAEKAAICAVKAKVFMKYPIKGNFIALQFANQAIINSTQPQWRVIWLKAKGRVRRYSEPFQTPGDDEIDVANILCSTKTDPKYLMKASYVYKEVGTVNKSNKNYREATKFLNLSYHIMKESIELAGDNINQLNYLLLQTFVDYPFLFPKSILNNFITKMASTKNSFLDQTLGLYYLKHEKDYVKARFHFSLAMAAGKFYSALQFIKVECLLQPVNKFPYVQTLNTLYDDFQNPQRRITILFHILIYFNYCEQNPKEMMRYLKLYIDQDIQDAVKKSHLINGRPLFDVGRFLRPNDFLYDLSNNIKKSINNNKLDEEEKKTVVNTFDRFNKILKSNIEENNFNDGVRSITNMDTITDMKNSDQIKVVKSNGSEPRNFKNGSHPVGVLDGLQSLRNDGVLCDISLKTDDGSMVFGHKNVLMAASPYFCAMFINFDESNKNLVNIRDLDSTALELLINYIYTGEIIVTEENVQSLLPAANLLQLDYVNGVCTKFMQTQLHPSNCLGMKAFADLHNCLELLTLSEAYIKKEFLYVAQCEEFLSLSYKEVVELISSNDLYVPYEEKMFECIINWVNYKLDSRKDLLPELMEHMHLPLVSIEYLLKKVVEEPLIKNSIKCKDYLIEALHFHLHKFKPDITIPQTIRCSSRQSAGLKKVVLVLSRSKTNQISTNWYDPTIDQWEIASEMSKCSELAHLLLIKDQFLFAVGGVDDRGYSRSVEILDLSSLSPIWVPTVNMLVSRTGLGVAVLDDFIYAVGGYDDESVSHLHSAEVFNINTKKWQMISSMTSKRSYFRTAVLNNRLYVIGGHDGFTYLKSVECYDPTLDKWTVVTNMSVCRSDSSVGVLDNVIYVVGGETIGGNYLKSVEAYKPSDGVWTSVADMHECRAFADVFALNGLLYIIGGRNIEGNSLDSVEIYNPNTNTWSMKILSSNVGRIYAAIAVNRPF